MKLFFVVPGVKTFRQFLWPLCEVLIREGASIYVVSGEKSSSMVYSGNWVVIPELTRKPNLVGDLQAMFRLLKLFWSESPDCVFSITPKMGFLSMLAAYLSFIKVRVHCHTGQVWVTRKGVSRWFFKTIERITAELSSHSLVDSIGQMQFLKSEGVLAIGHDSRVILNGSIIGVEVPLLVPFDSDTKWIGKPKHPIFLFVGRVNRDKGIEVLLRAFQRLTAECSAKLIIVGPFEDPSLVNEGLAGVVWVGEEACVNRYYEIADVLVMPSYREGFCLSVIEAASYGKPAIGSDIYGLADSISHKETGLLFPVGDVSELANCMRRLVLDPKYLRDLGINARARVERRFKREDVLLWYKNFFLEVMK